MAIIFRSPFLSVIDAGCLVMFGRAVTIWDIYPNALNAPYVQIQ